MERYGMIFYRFDDHKQMGSFDMVYVKIAEYHFYLVKETPCGYWITDRWYTISDFNMDEKNINYNYCHWVSKTARKRFAYPDRNQALESFVARKKRQIKILKTNLEFAEVALEKALTKQKKDEQIE
jgi:hypothetical protein